MRIGKLLLSEFNLKELILESNYQIDQGVPLLTLLV